ncbi:MAG: hypothetical protein JWL93_904 [Hyphomicrobiales bacterium]|nr:hypothetical protein [Hyphomicrobiales bacterium]
MLKADPSVGCVGEGREFPYRSYDHRGRVFGWAPPRGWPLHRAAFDIEAKAFEGSACVRARYFGRLSPFLLHWTSTEVAAKLLDVPILTYLKDHGAVTASQDWRGMDTRRGRASARIWMRSIDLGEHWATIGFIPSASQGSSWPTW